MSSCAVITRWQGHAASQRDRARPSIAPSYGDGLAGILLGQMPPRHSRSYERSSLG